LVLDQEFVPTLLKGRVTTPFFFYFFAPFSERSSINPKIRSVVMTLVLRRPYSLLDSMFDAMVSEPGEPTRARLDVIERAERYEVQVDLPGAKKEDIRVDIHENQVRISASSVVSRDLKEGDRALRTERQSTHYGRSFELPHAVQEDAAQAAFENGVLTLTLPKREARQGRRLQVS
jgi:HSP20 family protein